MLNKPKNIFGLSDFLADEIEECKEMLNDGLIDYFDRDRKYDITQEWKQALKDLKDLGYMNDDN